jgi:L-threonylcarbamoyladenylate synthase
MEIVKQAEADTERVCLVLNRGGLVVFPCETVYGAAVDATNPRGVNKLNTYKQRPLGKPYSIMCADQKMAEAYADLNETAKNLYKTFLPGPMTIISAGKHRVASGIESESGTIGIRIPNYPYLIDLLKIYGKPLTATSANASYKKRPYKIEDILENISDKQMKLIDLVIDAGELVHNEPSTVIDTTADDPIVLRQGDIKLKDTEGVVSSNEAETQNVGKEIWQKYMKFYGQRAIIFALEGPMGAGKTQFTKGIGRAMGITDDIISPTFNLELDYGPLIHIDAWRIQNAEELENLGFSKQISDRSVVVIEWADRVAETIRGHNEDAVVVWVKINYRNKDNERVINWGTL